MKKYISQLIILPVVIGMTFLSCTDQNTPTSSTDSIDLEGYSQTVDNAANKNATHQISNVMSFEDLSVVAEDGATLLRTHNNVRMTINTTDLDPHDTYTVWWVIFNNPGECEDGCGEPDLFNPDVNASILYAAGHVIGGNGKGNFAGTLRVGDLSGCQPPWEWEVFGEDDFDLCGEGLEDTQDAEIHLVVRTHEEKIPGMVNEQINTFAGGCTAGSSFGAGDGPNECEDQQFAVFEAVE